MSSRALLNIGLLLALALLVLVVVYEPGREPALEPTPLTGLQPTDITRLTLARSDQEDLRLYRAATHWYLEGTPSLRAEASQVRQLLRLVREPVQRCYAAADLDLARIGLGTEATRVLFNDQVELRFGSTDPLDDLRYVQFGEQVCLLRDFYQHLVKASAEQWISRRLLPGDEAIVALELPELSLQRDADGQWQLRPEPPDVDSDAVIALVERWRHAAALRVERAGLREPGLWVRIALEGQQAPVEFQLRQVGDDWRFLRSDLGLEYRVADYTARQLLQLAPTENAATP
jgi:hypothetical protein